MKTYTFYIGSYEQFAYTWEAKNLKDLRTMIEKAWPINYDKKKWFKVDSSGCPKGSKRFYIENNPLRPILIIPLKKRGNNDL